MVYRRVCGFLCASDEGDASAKQVMNKSDSQMLRGPDAARLHPDRCACQSPWRPKLDMQAHSRTHTVIGPGRTKHCRGLPKHPLQMKLDLGRETNAWSKIAGGQLWCAVSERWSLMQLHMHHKRSHVCQAGRQLLCSRENLAASPHISLTQAPRP